MLIKTIHIACAYATGLGFILRGVLALRQDALLQHRLTKILPHCIDTVLLLSAVAMLVTWSLSPLQSPWLLAKILALLAYIGCGFAMLRFGSTTLRRWLGLSGGLVCYGYIVAVAHSNNPMPFF